MSNDDTEEYKPKILSLSEKRKQKSDQTRKSYLPLEQRMAELEADMIRVIDSLADLDYMIHTQARITRLLVKAVANIASRIPDPEPPTKKR
jgi:hypothetical protein